MLMKSTLSYHHTFLMQKGEGTTTLPERMYWLMAPIVYVYTGGKTPSPELAPQEESEFLVTMIEAWECLVRDQGGVSSLKEGEEWGGKAAALDRGDFGGTVPGWAKTFREALRKADEGLLSQVVRCARNMDSEAESHTANLDAEEEASYLAMIMGQTVSRCLVDTLSLDVCLYVWDQCIMATFAIIVPRVCAAVLVCLKESIDSCTDRESFIDVLATQGKVIGEARRGTKRTKPKLGGAKRRAEKA